MTFKEDEFLQELLKARGSIIPTGYDFGTNQFTYGVETTVYLKILDWCIISYIKKYHND